MVSPSPCQISKLSFLFGEVGLRSQEFLDLGVGLRGELVPLADQPGAGCVTFGSGFGDALGFGRLSFLPLRKLSRRRKLL